MLSQINGEQEYLDEFAYQIRALQTGAAGLQALYDKLETRVLEPMTGSKQLSRDELLVLRKLTLEIESDTSALREDIVNAAAEVGIDLTSSLEDTSSKAA